MPVNSQKHLSRQLTSGEKRMTSYPRTFSSRQSASFKPIMGNSEESRDRDRIPLSNGTFIVNTLLDEEEQPLPLVPLRNKRMSWVKLKTYSLKVTVSEIPWSAGKIARDWWRFLGSSWISVYLNLTNQIHTQKRPVQEPKGILLLQQVHPCRSNPWTHGYKALRCLQAGPRHRSFWAFQT